MNNKIVILILLMLGLLTSCDYFYTHSYSVTNSSDTTVDVQLKTTTFEIDSIFKLTKDETKILYMTDHGPEGAKGPSPRDINKDLKIFIVTKGQLQSNRDYLKNSNWAFEKETYSTTITNDEF